MTSRVCLMAGVAYLREAALRAYGQWAIVDKQNVDQAAAEAWHSLREYEEGMFRAEHNKFIAKIKQQVLEELYREKHARLAAENYLMGRAVNIINPNNQSAGDHWSDQDGNKSVYLNLTDVSAKNNRFW